MRRRCAPFALTLAILLAPQPLRANEPPAYSDAAFAAAQKAGGLFVIEIWAEWCLPCKIQAPIIGRLRETGEFRSMRVLRVGEGTASEVWQRLRLSGYGTIVVYRGGKEVTRGTPTSEKALLALLRSTR